MTTEASAVTTPTDSAPVAVPELSSLTPEQRQTWRQTGEMPSKQDSAPADKKSAVPGSAPEKKDSAVSASDSAPEKKSQQPHRKPEDYGEKRFQELANENKTLKERLEALERNSKSTDKRDDKPVSQPAAVKDEPQAPPPLKQFLEKYFAEASNKGKSYEEGVEAWQDARDKYKDQQSEKKLQQALAGDRQRALQESAAKELQAKVSDANERYGKEEAGKIFPALEKIVADDKVPTVIKAMIDRSDVLVDLMYALASDAAEFDSFLKLCKEDPGAALEKVVTVQSLVRDQLKSNAGKPAKTEASTPERGEDGKFRKSEDAGEKKEAAAEPTTRAPRPPVEVGGRSSNATDEPAAAVKANDFRRAKQAFSREYAAQHKL